MVSKVCVHASLILKIYNVFFRPTKAGKKAATYSTFLAHSGGLLRVMKAQLVRIVNMINMLNIVGTKSRSPKEHLNGKSSNLGC